MANMCKYNPKCHRPAQGLETSQGIILSRVKGEFCLRCEVFVLMQNEFVVVMP